MISLEHIQPDDWPAVDRMRQVLQSLVMDTGGQSVGVRFGENTVNFAASLTSSTANIPHGLGKTPVIVWTAAHDTGTTALTPTGNVFTINASTFSVIFANPTAQTKTGMPFYWAVIG